jgi:hypothetical protein
VDPGFIVTTAEPFRALGHVPKRADLLPRATAIVGAEQTGRKRTGPQPAGLVRATGFERPDLKQHGLASSIGRKCRRWQFDPGFPVVVRAMQLAAEMPVLEHGVNCAVAFVMKRRSHRNAGKICPRDRPFPVFAHKRDDALSGRYQHPLSHAQPPVRIILSENR